MRKNFVYRTLLIALALLLCVSLVACNNDKTDVNEGDSAPVVTPDARRDAVDAFEDAFISLGGEGWKRDMTASEACLLTDPASYYVFRETAVALGLRLYADTDFQTSKIQYYTELLKRDETVEYARDVVSTDSAVGLLDILGNYELTSDDFASLAFIVFETALYDANSVLDSAAAALDATLNESPQFSAYRFLGEKAVELAKYASYDDTALAKLSKSTLRTILSEIKTLDANYGGLLDPSAAVTRAEITLLSDKITALRDELFETATAGSDFATLRAQITSLEEMLFDYVTEYELEEDVRDHSVMYSCACDLKAAIGSTMKLDADVKTWYAAIRLEAENYLQQLKLSVDIYRYIDVAENYRSVLFTKADYDEYVLDEEFDEASRTLLEERDSLGKLLAFAYKSGKLTNGVFGDSNVDGSDVLDWSDKTPAEAVAVIKSFALAAKEINDSFADNELADLAAALNVCSEPLSLLAGSSSVVETLDSALSYNSSNFVSYSTIVSLVTTNFDVLPLLLDVIYSSCYFGVDELSVQILSSVQAEDIDPAFLSTVLAKCMLAIVAPEDGETGISKEDLLSRVETYVTDVNALSAKEKQVRLSEDVEFWASLSTVTNVLLSDDGDDYLWRMTTATYDALASAFSLKSNIDTVKAEYSSGGLPASNSALVRAVEKLETATGISVSDSLTATEYNNLITAAENLLIQRNNAWFDLLAVSEENDPCELEIIINRMYYTTTAQKLNNLVSAYQTIESMTGITTTALNEYKAAARAAGVGGK